MRNESSYIYWYGDDKMKIESKKKQRNKEPKMGCD